MKHIYSVKYYNCFQSFSVCLYRFRCQAYCELPQHGAGSNSPLYLLAVEGSSRLNLQAFGVDIDGSGIKGRPVNLEKGEFANRV